MAGYGTGTCYPEVFDWNPPPILLLSGFVSCPSLPLYHYWGFVFPASPQDGLVSPPTLVIDRLVSPSPPYHCRSRICTSLSTRWICIPTHLATGWICVSRHSTTIDWGFALPFPRDWFVSPPTLLLDGIVFPPLPHHLQWRILVLIGYDKLSRASILLSTDTFIFLLQCYISAHKRQAEDKGNKAWTN